MKTQLIMLDTPIIVSDERLIHPNRGFTFVAGKIIKDCIGGQKIIAGIEGLPSINWNGLEEEFGWVDVEKLALKEYPDGIDGTNKSATIYRRIYIDGFKKAQSLNDKKFSLDDIEKSIEMIIELMRNKYTEFRTHKNTVLQSLQQPKVFDIEIDTEWNGGRAGDSRDEPKITNNSIKIIKKL